MKLWIPIKPQVKERARFRSQKRGGPYTPEKTVEYEKAVRRWWSENRESLKDAPVGVEIGIHSDGIEIEVFELEANVRPVGVLGDIDNYIKSILDGLQPHASDNDQLRGAFDNDRQVLWLKVYFVGPERKRKL